MVFRNKKLLLRCKHIFAKAPGNLEPPCSPEPPGSLEHPGSPEPPRGLMAMPDEMLLEICKKLCPNCSDIPKTNLLSLSMTCRRLRAIVQPFIYHDASPTKMWKFLRTITENKHLAAQVHHFCNRGGEWYWRRENDGPDHEESSNNKTELTEHEMNSTHYRLLEKTLTKLTKAKRLTIYMPVYKGYPWQDVLKVPVSMESVTRLSLIPWNPFGIDLGQMGAFLAMMPCLERLEVARCKIVTKQLPLASLRSLEFECSQMDKESLQNIIDSCPKLEHFAFGWTWKTTLLKNGKVALTWSQAQRILYSRRDTLKHLRLDFNQAMSAIFEYSIRKEEYFGSFREFDTLESLWVLTVGFGSKDSEGTLPTFPKTVQHLVRMLPRSLICIYFSGLHGKWCGIQMLAQAVQEGHFPRLKRVVVEGCHPLTTAVLQYYEELYTTLGVYFEILSHEKMHTRWKQDLPPAYT